MSGGKGMNFDELQEKIKALSPTNSATKVGEMIVIKFNGEEFIAYKSEDEIYESILKRIKKKKEMIISKRKESIENDFI